MLSQGCAINLRLIGGMASLGRRIRERGGSPGLGSCVKGQTMPLLSLMRASALATLFLTLLNPPSASAQAGAQKPRNTDTGRAFRLAERATLAPLERVEL